MVIRIGSYYRITRIAGDASPAQKEQRNVTLSLTFMMVDCNNAVTWCMGPYTDGRDKRLGKGKASEDRLLDGAGVGQLGFDIELASDCERKHGYFEAARFPC
jgi:hypothetical protein